MVGMKLEAAHRHFKMPNSSSPMRCSAWTAMWQVFLRCVCRSDALLVLDDAHGFACSAIAVAC